MAFFSPKGELAGCRHLLPWEIWLLVWFFGSLFTRRTVAAETAAQRGGYMVLAVAAFVLVFWANPPWTWGALGARLYPGLPGWYVLGACLCWCGSGGAMSVA